VTGLDLYGLVGNLEHERASANLDQFERARVVSVAEVALTRPERPRPQFQWAPAHLQQCAAAGRLLPQLGRLRRSTHAECRLVVAYEVGEGYLERVGKAKEGADARVGVALLDLDDQAAADPAPRRQVIQRPRTRGAKSTHSFRERPRYTLFGSAPLKVPPALASNFVLGSDRAYTRDDATPIWEAFEDVLGGLEHGVAVAFASGMAAAAAIFDLLPAGADVVLPDDCYQAVVGLAAAGQELGRWSVTRLAPDDTKGWLRAAGHADLLWLESPSKTCPQTVRSLANASWVRWRGG
jgi:Cys/Met metabolism PLP-dependent enzyme